MGYFGDLAVSTFIAVDEEGGSEVEMEGVGAKLLPYPSPASRSQMKRSQVAGGPHGEGVVDDIRTSYGMFIK